MGIEYGLGAKHEGPQAGSPKPEATKVGKAVISITDGLSDAHPKPDEEHQEPRTVTAQDTSARRHKTRHDEQAVTAWLIGISTRQH